MSICSLDSLVHVAVILDNTSDLISLTCIIFSIMVHSNAVIDLMSLLDFVLYFTFTAQVS